MDKFFSFLDCFSYISMYVYYVNIHAFDFDLFDAVLLLLFSTNHMCIKREKVAMLMFYVIHVYAQLTLLMCLCCMFTDTTLGPLL